MRSRTLIVALSLVAVSVTMVPAAEALPQWNCVIGYNVCVCVGSVNWDACTTPEGEECLATVGATYDGRSGYACG